MLSLPVSGQVYLSATDDAFTSNDLAAGPGTTGDRSDFVEIRYYEDASTNRRRIGYFKYDISEIDSALLPFATLAGTFANGRDGNGEFNVYGLNDGVLNTDDDPSVTEANWSEGSLSFSKGLGVDTSEPSGLGNTLGLDLNEVTLLGTITLVDGEPLQSNTTDLDLSTFLSSDTNDVVTFLLADERTDMGTGLPVGTEWRITAREASSEDSLRLAFIPLEGDTNLSGAVTPEDLIPINMNFGATGLTYTDGDLNGDNVIDYADFRHWKNGFLAGGGQSSDIAALTDLVPVPEPTSACLVLLVVGGGIAQRFCANRWG
ncbi:Uncharacterized protein SCF082_LOCUS22166 [Durusdinium trenchii]|uniref:PEP-CTERM protein-sorting domain-containing protein n=1 Tax=Durusdinium trenchii TaxID=1381693 RepID=A0ABP0LEQ0_9DINO